MMDCGCGWILDYDMDSETAGIRGGFVFIQIAVRWSPTIRSDEPQTLSRAVWLRFVFHTSHITHIRLAHKTDCID